MKRILFILFCMLPVSAVLLAQQRTVSGLVKDNNGLLQGVTVIEKGLPDNGTTTDAEGRFQLTLRGTTNTIVFQSVSYATREFTVKNDNRVEVTLQSAVQSMNEVVVVGYGKKTRITNTGSVSSINANQIREVPTSSVQNALTGRVPGFFAQQRSGQPGRDASDFFIRGVSSLNPEGNRPLIIVDDIEYTYEQLAQINVNEIENISVLKDASSTAIYGIKGANGVLVVTTRRGASGRPKVNVRIESGVQTPVRKLTFLDSYNSAVLVNEALRNDGLAEQFTQTDLDLFQSGTDPYGHPNVNWYKEIFKPYSLQANTNVDVSGGTEGIKYFISGGAFTQNGALKNFGDPASEINNNYFYRRYNFRSNLDIRATKGLNLRLDIATRFADINEPGAQNVISEIYDFTKIHPYSAPLLNPNGSYAFAHDTKEGLATINARLANNGYNRSKRTDFNILFGGTQNLDLITRGLQFTFRVAYASLEQNERRLFRGSPYGAYSPPSYYFNPSDNSYTLDGRGQYRLDTYGLLGNTNLYDRNINVQAFLNYDRTFGSHHFSSLALFNRQSSSSMANVPANFRGYSLRLSYDYQQRYLIDFNTAYNGSDRFQADKRYGLFPAVGLGWNISKEAFFEKALPVVNLLKLRATYGLVGSDVVSGNRYLYNQVYNTGGGYSFGETNGGYGTIYEGSLGNSNVTWEKSRQFDVGVDMNLLDDKIALSVAYFNNFRYDQLITKGSVPLVLGIGFAPTNVGEVRNTGFDGQISYRNNIGKLQYNINGTFSLAKNKILYMDETAPAFPWLARTGLPIGQPFGYTFAGFYQDQTDIEKSAKPNSSVPIQPGDLKYADLNGDGVIDENDQGAIGKPNLPNSNVGLNLGANYKGFSVNVLFQGSFNYSFSVVGTGIETFQSQFQPIHQLRWVPGSGNNASFPRLTSNPTTVNSSSAYPSDFWQIDAQYVRLKTVELGYQLSQRALPFKIDNARLYLSGYNLFTWTNYSLYQQDPEVSSNTAGDAYLNQRVVNVGLQIGF